MINHLSIRRYPSTTQLQKLFDFSLDVICSIDIDGNFIDVSNAVFDVLGYHPNELVGRPYIELVADEDRFKTEGIAWKIMQGQKVTNFENRYVHKNGKVVPMSWSAQWDGREKMMFCIARDTSEQKAQERIKVQYEQAIRQQNKEMHQMLERIADGFFAMDTHWHIIYANTQAEQILHAKKEDYLGRNFWECFPDMVGTIYYEQYQKAMSEKVAVHFEAFFPPFNMWFAINAYPSETGLSVFFRDVTEHKREVEQRLQYEDKIAQQNKELLNLLEGMKEGFYSLDNDFRVLQWNRQMEVIAGVSRDAVLGQVILHLLPESLICIYKPLFFQALEQKAPIHKEFLCPTSNRWMDLSIYPSDAGLSVFCEDIHDRKIVEQELQMLSLIAKETENAVVIITPDRKTTWVNAAFTRMTGYSFEEIIGKVPGELLVGPDTNKETERFIMEEYQKKRPFHVEVLNYKKSGEPFWSEMHIQPLFDSNGNVEQFFSIRKDITERKKLEQKLEEERKRTTAAVIAAQERERTLVSQELHDNVNQVLTTVKLYTELCRDGIGNVQETMDKSARLLQDSINEIRSLSKRLSAPSIGNIRLQDSIKDLIDAVAATNKLCIVLQATAIENLEVDQEVHIALYRILQEHLTNILKHAKADYVQIIFENMHHNQLSLQVTDNGVGFNTKLKRKGIGITNMISRAESIRGTLVVNSAPGMGCELLVYFKLKQ